MSDFDRPSHYRIYLLTCWEERNGSPDVPVTWRFKLEKLRAGQRRGFATLEALMAHLRTELAAGQNKPI